MRVSVCPGVGSKRRGSVLKQSRSSRASGGGGGDAAGTSPVISDGHVDKTFGGLVTPSCFASFSFALSYRYTIIHYGPRTGRRDQRAAARYTANERQVTKDSTQVLSAHRARRAACENAWPWGQSSRDGRHVSLTSPAHNHDRIARLSLHTARHRTLVAVDTRAHASPSRCVV